MENELQGSTNDSQRTLGIAFYGLEGDRIMAWAGMRAVEMGRSGQIWHNSYFGQRAKGQDMENDRTKVLNNNSQS